MEPWLLALLHLLLGLYMYEYARATRYATSIVESIRSIVPATAGFRYGRDVPGPAFASAHGCVLAFKIGGAPIGPII